MMAGSSVGAMVVGTVFIMVFGMATVTMVESIDDSVKNSEYELSDPEVILVSVTDKVESTGPVLTVSLGTTAGTGYADGPVTCTTTGAGTGLTLSVSATDGGVTSASIVNPGDDYSTGDNTVTIASCGDGTATIDIDSLHDQNTITIRNTGSETVDLSHIFLTLSDTGTKIQGTPFTPFVNHYSGTNLYLFPGEELSTAAFPLDSNTHGFAIDDDPNRAFLAIYEYNDAEIVTIT